MSSWTHPCAGRVTSPYGPRVLAGAMSNFHHGVDLAAKRGPVYAARDGVVRTIFITSKGGWVVDIRHPDEGGRQVRTRYIHMLRDEIRVKAGTKVRAGQQIGNSGDSGSEGKPHLHFEVMVDGALIDPVPFMRARGVTFQTVPVSNTTTLPTAPTGPGLGSLPDPLEDDMPTIKEITDALHGLEVYRDDQGRAVTLAECLTRVGEIDRRTQALLAVPGVPMDSRERTIAQQVLEVPVIDRPDGSKVLVWQAIALAASGGTDITAADIAAAIPDDLARQVADELARRIVS